MNPSRSGNCVFCDIADGASDTELLAESSLAVCFTPLNPVVEGHELVVPRQHARYIWELEVDELGGTMELLQKRAEGQSCNVIQSNGVAASQTIPHVHFHIVPREGFDGLHLPWTGQRKAVPVPDVLAAGDTAPCNHRNGVGPHPRLLGEHRKQIRAGYGERAVVNDANELMPGVIAQLWGRGTWSVDDRGHRVFVESVQTQVLTHRLEQLSLGSGDQRLRRVVVDALLPQQDCVDLAPGECDFGGGNESEITRDSGEVVHDSLNLLGGLLFALTPDHGHRVNELDHADVDLQPLGFECLLGCTVLVKPRECETHEQTDYSTEEDLRGSPFHTVLLFAAQPRPAAGVAERRGVQFLFRQPQRPSTLAAESGLTNDSVFGHPLGRLHGSIVGRSVAGDSGGISSGAGRA